MSLKSFTVKTRLKSKFTRIFLLCCLAFIIMLASYARLFDYYENILLDVRFRIRPPQPYSHKIVIIEVSDDTLKQLDYWPLPRDFHASMVDVLSYFGVEQVFFDFLFVESTREDGILAKSIKSAGNVYLPFVFDFEQKGVAKRLPLSKSRVASLLPKLARAAKGTGHINSSKDPDGKVRRAPLLVNERGVIKPHIAVRMICDHMGLSCKDITLNRNSVIIDKRLIIPTSPSGAILVNYAGRWDETFRHYSYIDILASWKQSQEGKVPRIPLADLKGTICFVGLTATGTSDLHAIPFENNYPMVGLHANIFNSLLLDQYIVRADQWLNILLLILLLAAVYFTTTVKKKKPLEALLRTLGYGSGLVVLGCLLFVFFGIWIDLFYPLVILILFYTALRIYSFLQESRRIELMERELTIAKQIQESFLPEPKERFHSLEVSTRMVAAKHVGGDLYDMQALEKDRFGILIGDVSGKGVAAALIMAKTITLFRTVVSCSDKPSEVLFRLNKEIARDMKPGMFVTAMYLIYEPKRRKITVASAGHGATLVFRKQDDKVEKIEPQEGMPLGLMEEVEYSQEEIVLEEGDRIILYTDGVTEAMNLKREEFEIERLISVVKKATADASSKNIREAIEKQIAEFVGKAPQHDDCTIIVLKEYGP